jgi:hypothetical protein
VALSYFKNKFPCNEDGELNATPSISEEVINEMRSEVFDKTEDELDFDGEKGQQLLRILLQMTMNDFPPLTSQALKVLFRHFNQYHELVDDLKQVQLLVSNRDVSNYRQIDRDLFVLKNLTEKSELWVHWGITISTSMRTKPKSLAGSRSMSGDDLLNDHIIEDEHDDHELSKLASDSIDCPVIDYGPLPPPRYIEFIKDYYPQNKKKCIQMLQQVKKIFLLL